jgi:hypothetical protein
MFKRKKRKNERELGGVQDWNEGGLNVISCGIIDFSMVLFW